MNTKEKIILACQELALTRGRGFYNLSMDELAAEAGVAKRTIYRYFAGKEELFEATMMYTMEEIVAANTALFASGKDIQEILGALVKNIAYLVNPQVLSDLGSHYPLLWQKVDKMRQNKIEFLINYVLEQSPVKMRWRVDQRIFKAALGAAITQVISPKFVLESGLSLEEVGYNFLNMFLFGAVEPDGEDKLR